MFFFPDLMYINLGGGGGEGGNFGMGVRASILKPVPIIYLALKKTAYKIHILDFTES